MLEEVFNESLNIYWINEALTNLGVGLVPLVKSPPVSEGLFNFVLLWALMFAPVIFTDGPSQKVKNKVGRGVCMGPGGAAGALTG